MIIELVILIGFVAWYVIGFASWVFWWTRSFDMTTDDLETGAVVAMMGPVMLLFGGIIYSEMREQPPRVLFKKRDKS